MSLFLLSFQSQIQGSPIIKSPRECARWISHFLFFCRYRHIYIWTYTIHFISSKLIDCLMNPDLIKILNMIVFFSLLICWNHKNKVIFHVMYLNKLSKEMHKVIAHAQIAHEQSVWGIIRWSGCIVNRVLVGVDDSIRRNRRTRSSKIGNPIKDDISIRRMVDYTALRPNSACFSRILITTCIYSGKDCMISRYL